MSEVARTYGERQSDDDPIINKPGTEISTTSETHSAVLIPRSNSSTMLTDLGSSSDSEDESNLPTASIRKQTLGEQCEEGSGFAKVKQHMTVSQIMQSDGSDDELEAIGAYERLQLEMRMNRVSNVLTSKSSHEIDQSTHFSNDEAQMGSSKCSEHRSTITPTHQSTKERLQRLALKNCISAEESQPKVEAPEAHHGNSSGTDSEDIEAKIRMSSTKKPPRRAATKKALEEMHKETERIQRSMTLAPDAQVKTKLNIKDFLAKVGFVKPDIPPKTAETTSTDLRNDTETHHDEDPFSLVLPEAKARIYDESMISKPFPKLLPISSAFANELEESDEDIELPSINTMNTNQNPRSALPKLAGSITIHEDVLLDSDSDDGASSSQSDLPVRLKNHKLLFQKRNFAQIKKDRQAAKFVAMARPDSPSKVQARAEKARKAELIAQAALEAKAERLAREAALKASGVTLVSAEQRAREALEIENLVDKARKQADELRRLERREDQKRKAEADGMADHDSESDDDWQGDVEDGSVSEDGTEDSDTEDVSQGFTNHNAIAGDVQDDDRSGHILAERKLTDHLDEDHEAGDDCITNAPKSRRSVGRARISRIVDPDDDLDEDKENSQPIGSAFNVSYAGLTQLFEPTQPANASATRRPDISATQFLESPPSYVRDSMRDLRGPPIDMMSHSLQGRPITGIDLSRQLEDRSPSTQPEVLPDGEAFNNTQFSVFDPPSPEEALTPRLPRLQTQYTQATEVDPSEMGDIAANLLEAENGSAEPSVEPRPRKLRRARDLSHDPSEPPLNNAAAPVNAFKVMRKAMDEAQHQKSRNAFLDDRAVESDDEYAGLGGAFDEEPEDATTLALELEDMIDHTMADEDAEGQQRIAAFYAKKDLENDEKLVNSLMNDINNGGLRRKRGAGLLDMDDSEDEEEEAARHKARQALMRARLLESQNLTSLAENPKTKAFIQALEDDPGTTAFIEIVGEEEEIAIAPEGSVIVSNDADKLSLPSNTISTISAISTQHTTDASQATFKRPNKKPTRADIQRELSFLTEDDENSQNSLSYDPSFVPSLKRERSSLSIQDRSHLSRENSQTWRDPKSNSQTEDSLYSQLASSRTSSSRDTSGPAVVVISKGTHVASRMATKAVNYHARAAQALKNLKGDKFRGKEKKNVVGGTKDGKSKKQDVLRLLA